MTIRPPRLADLAAVHAVETAVFGSHVYPDFFFRQAFDLWPGLFFVADGGDGELDGYIVGAPSEAPGAAWVLSLAVRARARGRGVGRALSEALIAALAARGAGSLTLTVDPANAGALALYRKLGFAAVGEEAAYFGPGEARRVMRLALPAR
ncbi:GNAT family N-acetyltransferase [Crenobacter luteus]|uniref:Acetyltransferase n=1 Tax=Crenobacter luteus TaxID=1452487 RepID=A0A163CHT2_9NEIS|nr:N-acetyltransferase [Crenobacter luteus]KZE32466.1 acetyltransferase [Crenobacter luteus]